MEIAHLPYLPVSSLRRKVAGDMVAGETMSWVPFTTTILPGALYLYYKYDGLKKAYCKLPPTPILIGVMNLDVFQKSENSGKSGKLIYTGKRRASPKDYSRFASMSIVSILRSPLSAANNAS